MEFPWPPAVFSYGHLFRNRHLLLWDLAASIDLKQITLYTSLALWAYSWEAVWS